MKIQPLAPLLPRPRIFLLLLLQSVQMGYGSLSALRRHERDSHGPRMRCGTCEKFTCPESRHFKMKRHLEMVRGVRSESPQRKNRKHLKSVLVVPETLKIPPSPVIAATHCMPTMGDMAWERTRKLMSWTPSSHLRLGLHAILLTFLLLSHLLSPLSHLLSFHLLLSHLLSHCSLCNSSYKSHHSLFC